MSNVEHRHRAATMESIPPPEPPTAVPHARRPQQSRLSGILHTHWLVFTSIGLFSCVINVLMLTGPLFMLQIYDRVLTSRSVPTLVALFMLVTALYIIMSIMEVIRSRVLIRLGLILDRDLARHLYEIELTAALHQPGKGRPLPLLRELDALRTFISGSGITTFLDAPWIPIYVGVIFLFSKWLGIAAIIGALMLICIAALNEWLTVGPQKAAADAHASEERMLDGIARNAEIIKAHGMYHAIQDVWRAQRFATLAQLGLSGDRASAFASFSRTFRLYLQSAMLAIGAYLVLGGEITAGAIVAITMLYGRALQPIEQFIAQWRGLQRARVAGAAINKAFSSHGAFSSKTKFPPAEGHLLVDDLRVVAPGTQRLLLKRRNDAKGVTFALRPGQSLGVIGPSGAGKSTLVRAILGVWPPQAVIGRIELDGIPITRWDPHQLGRQIGYVPQEVQLFAGSIKQNIARFEADADDRAVIEAAMLAGVHRMIGELPESYETEVGHMGAALSVGQRQRIALARALYGNPHLIVMDEPNSNLDSLGEDALTKSLLELSRRGKTVILTSHRAEALRQVDFLLLLGRGEPIALGPRSDVLAKLRFMSQQGAQNRPPPLPEREGKKS